MRDRGCGGMTRHPLWLPPARRVLWTCRCTAGSQCWSSSARRYAASSSSSCGCEQRQGGGPLGRQPAAGLRGAPLCCVAATPDAHSMAVVAWQGAAKDLLFLSTERYKFCVLEYDTASGAPPPPTQQTACHALPSRPCPAFSSGDRIHALTLPWRPGELLTRANGDIRGITGRPADSGQLGMVDPDCRAIGLHLYEGLLKVQPLGGSLPG